MNRRMNGLFFSALLIAGLPWWGCAPALSGRAESPAEAQVSAAYAEPIKEARAAVRTLTDTSMAPGLSVTVGVEGQIVWSEGFGYADLEQMVPVNPGLTRFRIGSISKSLTAAAVAQLVQQGRLDLDAPVQEYVPSFPEKSGVITTRQLTGHLAGIRHYRGAEMIQSRKYATVLEGLSIFQEDTLLHPPGSQYSYSSYGWNLVSAVVEGASGEDFLGYMNALVFRPLGMGQMVADHTDSIIVHRTRFYTRRDTVVLNAPYVDNSYKWAGGGFIGTTEDLVRFGTAHVEPGFLRPETLELLLTSQRTTSGEGTGYGIGWRSGTDDQGRVWFGHGGSSVGGRASLLVYPGAGVVVAVLTNMGGVPVGDAASEIATTFLNRER